LAIWADRRSGDETRKTVYHNMRQPAEGESDGGIFNFQFWILKEIGPQRKLRTQSILSADCADFRGLIMTLIYTGFSRIYECGILLRLGRTRKHDSQDLQD